ncbi:hypothetical protein NFX46_26730 [Streptomyces phaeoluteigriseus]|uniref:Amidase n=1 Tax=Streptomyces phaeoluteigriseus TaxID=114686 RepID=A0ABY4ZDH3_9ACTN|nr:hypothetical protein [Streptomyces phaeoluteigriseus]USQ86995.1 hypothetical protein NFX46_26730 [Streptomyces phaeoluteigriseus]
MSRPSYVRRPTEVAAIRAAARSARPQPPVTSLMAALIEANDRRDREAVTLCAHRVVRTAAPEVGE